MRNLYHCPSYHFILRGYQYLLSSTICGDQTLPAPVRSQLYKCLNVTINDNGNIAIVVTIVMVHLVFVLLLFSVARAQLYTPWNVTECTYHPSSCHTEEQKVRDCETICYENRTCEIRIGAIFPNDSFYIVNLEEVLNI